MLSLLNEATGRDLLIVFAAGVVAGVLYKVADLYLLSRVENALQIPSGTIA